MTEKKGYLLVALAACFGGTSGTLVKLLQGYSFDSFSVTFLRAFIAFVIASSAALLLRRADFRVPMARVPFLAGYGVVTGGLSVLLYYYTFSLTSVAAAVVLLYTAPVIAILLSRLLLGEPITIRKLAALGLALAGCILVVGLYQPGNLKVSAFGVLCGLGAAFTFALSSIYGKKATAHFSPLTIVVYVMGFGALFLLPFRPLAIAAVPAAPPAAWLLLLALGLFPALLDWWFYLAGLRRVEVGRATLVATLEPVVAMLLAFLVLGETMEFLQILGATLIIGAALLAQSGAKRPVETAVAVG